LVEEFRAKQWTVLWRNGRSDVGAVAATCDVWQYFMASFQKNKVFIAQALAARVQNVRLSALKVHHVAFNTSGSIVGQLLTARI
jgi:type VI protein secretion system component VasK